MTATDKDILDDRIEVALAAYVECALWSSLHYESEHDDNPVPFDDIAAPDDFAPEALASMWDDVAAFIADQSANLDAANISDEQAGHDFWLTRNCHGAGFWDRGNGEIGEALADAARVYGECDLYLGDDGKVYVS